MSTLGKAKPLWLLVLFYDNVSANVFQIPIFAFSWPIHTQIHFKQNLYITQVILPSFDKQTFYFLPSEWIVVLMYSPIWSSGIIAFEWRSTFGRGKNCRWMEPVDTAGWIKTMKLKPALDSPYDKKQYLNNYRGQLLPDTHADA